jgi:hypothetical protein
VREGQVELRNKMKSDRGGEGRENGRRVESLGLGAGMGPAWVWVWWA